MTHPGFSNAPSASWDDGDAITAPPTPRIRTGYVGAAGSVKRPSQRNRRDGNAVAILATCLTAARAAGWTDAQVTAFLDRARAGDYDHLLRVVMQEFDVRRSESGSASVSGSSGTSR